MANTVRITVASLALSAAAFVGYINMEGWTDEAVIPVKGDVPTVGPGLTTRPNGQPVRMGDTITPLEGINRSFAIVRRNENAVKRCVTAPLSQVEYDLMVDFSYQYGAAALCNSSVVKRANAADYKGSCEAYRLYKFADGYDCSTPGNHRCPGVWTRSLNRYQRCMEAQ